METEEIYTKTGIKNTFGWTDAMLQYLPKTSRRKMDTFFQPHPAWSETTIKKTAQIPEVKKLVQKNQRLKIKRKKAANKAIASKTEKLADFIIAQGVYVEHVPQGELEKMAEKGWSDSTFDKHMKNGKFIKPSDHQIVDIIRHQYTNYDSLIDKIKHKIGKRKAFVLVADKIFPQMLKVYPQYKKEIKTQWENHQKR